YLFSSALYHSRRARVRDFGRAQSKLLFKDLSIMLADRGRGPANGQPLAVDDREAAGIFQMSARHRIADILPEASGRELRVPVYVFNGGYRVAQHPSFHHAFEKLAFS